MIVIYREAKFYRDIIVIMEKKIKKTHKKHPNDLIPKKWKHHGISHQSGWEILILPVSLLD